MEKNFDFEVPAKANLVLENLFSQVHVSVREINSVSVVLTGDEEIIGEIEVKQMGMDVISVKGKGDDIIPIIKSGHGTRVSVSNISCSGDISIVNGVVSINGRVVDANAQGKKREMAKVQVFVPKGTSIELSDLSDTSIIGVGGKLNARLSGQSQLTVRETLDVKVKGSGQTRCELKDVLGKARFSVSGQSSIFANGEFDDIEVEASGMSNIVVIGNCDDVEVKASGMSHVKIYGKVRGRVRQDQSGMSSIDIR